MFVVLSFIWVHPSLAQDDSSYSLNVPRFATYDLIQTGNLTNPYITPIIDFNYLVEFSLILHFSATNYDITLFGDDTALTNGVNVLYHGISLFDNKNVSSNDDMDQYFDNFRYQVDAHNPKQNQIVATYIFTQPVLLTPDINIYVYVQDDITTKTTVNEFFVRFQGYDVHEHENVNPALDTQQKDWLTMLEQIWNNAGTGTQIVVLLTVIAGVLLVWVTLKRIRQSF